MFPGQRTDLAVDSLQQTWETKTDHSINHSVYQLIHPFTHPSTHPSIHPSIQLFIHLFIVPKADITSSKYLVATSFSFVSQVLIGYFYVMVGCSPVDAFELIRFLFAWTLLCSNTCDICMFEKKLKETTINKKLIKVLLINCQGIQIILHI